VTSSLCNVCEKRGYLIIIRALHTSGWPTKDGAYVKFRLPSGEGEPTGEFSGSAAVDVHDSVVSVALNSTSELSCISSLSTGGEEAECAAGGEGRVPETDRRSPESPADPTPKLRPDLVVICCLVASSVSSLMLKGLHGTQFER